MDEMRTASSNGSSIRGQSLVRWRAGLLVAAILLPLALFVLFERQARRLDALATHGESVDAQVTAVSRDNHTTFYAYRVNGSEYTWSVARSEAPFPVGHVFPATYLPVDPSLSRPIAERGLAAEESTRNRGFSWRVVLGLGVTLVLFAGLAHRDLCRLRSGAPSELSDPRAYRRRLVFTALLLVAALVLIGGFHLRAAIEHGESVVPVVIAACLSIGILGAMFFFAARDGPKKAHERSTRLLRWLVPVTVGIALLRLIAMLWGE